MHDPAPYALSKNRKNNYALIHGIEGVYDIKFIPLESSFEYESNGIFFYIIYLIFS
jgi:hypothetical protein